MVSVAGASQYRNASILANTKQMAAQSPTLLGETYGSTSTMSLLEGSRDALRIRGFGISGRARNLNNQLMGSTADVNQMFSLAAGTDSNIEGAQTLVKALRAKYGYQGSLVEATKNAIAEALRQNAENAISESSLGTVVDTEA